MKLHGNAALTPKQRLRLARRIVDEGWSLAEAAEAAEVSERTARKWAARYRAEGEAGLVDRPSTPNDQPRATPEDRIDAIAALRRLRMTGAEIAECLGMALSTVQGILTRIGLGRLSRLEPSAPANRYERQRPGELIHIDVKKLGRIGHKGAPATAPPAAAKTVAGRAGRDGSSFTSASTTPPGSPTSSCWATRRRRPASAS
jgi:leucine-zipper of insertion element IS481